MGTEPSKCECEHSNHDEVACHGLPERLVKTEYGWFWLCRKCFMSRHMAGLYSLEYVDVTPPLE